MKRSHDTTTATRRRSPQVTSVEPRLRQGQYRLSEDVARRVWLGHPWVFREALGVRSVGDPTGSLVDLLAGNREFVARGFVDQDHAIVVRVLSRDPAAMVAPGSAAVATRFSQALQLRTRFVDLRAPAGLRLFAGESEGLPGVTVDRYGDFVVVQWLSGGALPWRDDLLAAIGEQVSPRGIYEQKRLRPLAGQAAPQPAVRVSGEEAPLEVVVEEAACRFGVDVTAPLGVGFFPDLRRGRDAVAALAPGRRVLNLFSYTGGFSVRAAKAGAAEVVAVDTAGKAHARARKNYELSGLDPAKMEAITADAVKALDRFADRGRQFDLVVCDPPTFSHGHGGATFSVATDLGHLAAACTRVLSPDGVLAFATNSTKVSPLDLDRAMAEGAATAGANLRIIDRVGPPADFPVAPGFPEGNYLKFVLACKA